MLARPPSALAGPLDMSSGCSGFWLAVADLRGAQRVRDVLHKTTLPIRSSNWRALLKDTFRSQLVGEKSPAMIIHVRVSQEGDFMTIIANAAHR